VWCAPRSSFIEFGQLDLSAHRLIAWRSAKCLSIVTAGCNAVGAPGGQGLFQDQIEHGDFLVGVVGVDGASGPAADRARRVSNEKGRFQREDRMSFRDDRSKLWKFQWGQVADTQPGV
jgi:hypothetical protein